MKKKKSQPQPYAKSRCIADKLAKLAAMPEKNPYPILVVSTGGDISYLNDTAWNVLPNLTCKNKSHPALQNLAAIAKLLHETKQNIISREVDVDNATFEQHISLIPKTDYLRIFMVDVTRRKQLEQMKDEFISTVSHELRTPLSIIKGAVANVKDLIAGPLNKSQTELMEIADRNIMRLTRLINDILDLSRLESGRTRVTGDRVSPKNLLEQLSVHLKAHVHAKNIKLITLADPNMPEIDADSGMALQVLSNLVANAFQYTKSRITVRASLAPDHVMQQTMPNEAKEDSMNDTQPLDFDTYKFVQFTVEDDGNGIAPENLGQLFNKFVQIDRPMGGAGYKGTGLGLAICREIVQKHHGKIWVESSPGFGSCFSFTLPVYDEKKKFWKVLESLLRKNQSAQEPLVFIRAGIANSQKLKEQILENEWATFFESWTQTIREKVIRFDDLLLFDRSDNTISIFLEGTREGGKNLMKRFYEATLEFLALHQLPVKPEIHFGMAMYPVDATNEKDLVNFAMKNTLCRTKLTVASETRWEQDQLA